MQHKDNGIVKQLNEKKSLEKSHYLNLPDLQFFNWCSENFKINKGVFNTVDEWFYKNGVENIMVRRIYLLAFFEYVAANSENVNKQKVIRFGHGGLIRKLQDFKRIID
ncbi:hypothetical protein [Cytobacillus purgationiresistens]|uniref:Uncharacterized protein n=1 Tax=Cytobacillus purgationiresistens TaxID=863449 RepID=A0ABU0AC42_9BACI|nr:hypothetical protein [Cytobacillus purgationiresistens]MDQ0268829.1 hypothetical protein [Cytobacillus purgationiresistens]